MRHSAAALAILFVAAGFASSVAVPSIKSERAETAPEHLPPKAIAQEKVRATSDALTGENIANIFDLYAPRFGSRRLLERIDERISQELAARKYKRADPAVVAAEGSNALKHTGLILENLIGAIAATGVVAGFDVFAPQPSHRSVLPEGFEGRVNSEFATRAYKPEPLPAPLDNLD